MLRKLFVVLAMAVAATAQLQTKGNLLNKPGMVLYTAAYTNLNTTRTQGAYTGLFTSPTGTTAAFNGSVGVSTIYTFTVADKKTGANKNWKNIFSIHSAAFPPTVTDNAFAGATNAIITETYQLTSADPTTAALLGSLNWGATYAAPATGSLTGSGIKMVFPAQGTGVYKQAKAVAIAFNANGARAVSILKSI